MKPRPRTSLETQITALRRRLLRLDKEERRTALLELMDGLRFFPLSYGPHRNKRTASKRAAASKQAEAAP